MILIKEITIENCQAFKGLPANIMVVEHKRGDKQMKHSFYLIGMIVSELGEIADEQGDHLISQWQFHVQFTNGSRSGVYNSVKDLLQEQAKYFSFYYIEIKK